MNSPFRYSCNHTNGPTERRIHSPSCPTRRRRLIFIVCFQSVSHSGVADFFLIVLFAKLWYQLTRSLPLIPPFGLPSAVSPEPPPGSGGLEDLPAAGGCLDRARRMNSPFRHSCNHTNGPTERRIHSPSCPTRRRRLIFIVCFQSVSHSGFVKFMSAHRGVSLRRRPTDEPNNVSLG